MTLTDEINAARKARRDARIAGRPAGSKVCPRCKGFGSREGWRATGSTCARCTGHGYCLDGDQLAAHCATAAEKHLAELTERGREMRARKDATTGLAGLRGWRASQERAYQALRVAWATCNATAKALRALVGNSPTLAAVKEAGGGTYGAGRR